MRPIKGFTFVNYKKHEVIVFIGKERVHIIVHPFQCLSKDYWGARDEPIRKTIDYVATERQLLTIGLRHARKVVIHNTAN